MKITHGGTLPDSSDKDDLYAIIDDATGTDILDADISSGAAISDSKLATIATAGKVNVTALTGQIPSSNLAQITAASKVSGSALTLLGNIPASAGIIPSANLQGGGGAFGAWTAKDQGTVYQAETDGFVVATASGTGNEALLGYSDSSTPPTTLIARVSEGDSNYAVKMTITFPVKRDDYWQFTCGEADAAGYWISIGT